MRLIDVDNYCKNLCRCCNAYCDKEKCPIFLAPTVDICTAVESLEKQIPKKPISVRTFHDLRCPICKGYVETEVDQYEYCPNCGQRIDWSEENE